MQGAMGMRGFVGCLLPAGFGGTKRKSTGFETTGAALPGSPLGIIVCRHGWGGPPRGAYLNSPPWLSFISLGASHGVLECGAHVGEDLANGLWCWAAASQGMPMDGSGVKEGFWDQEVSGGSKSDPAVSHGPPATGWVLGMSSLPRAEPMEKGTVHPCRGAQH